MTEAEANEHIADLARGEDAIDKLVYFAKLAARLLNRIAGSALLEGKPPFGEDVLDPWAEKKTGDSRLSGDQYQAEIRRRVEENKNAKVREE